MRIRYNHKKGSIPHSKRDIEKDDDDEADSDVEQLEDEWDQYYDDIDSLEGKRKVRKAPKSWNEW